MKVANSVLIMGMFGLAAAAESESQAQTGVNPIRKVVTLMQEMQKEVEAEGVAAKDLFDKFYCYCTSNRDDLKKQAASATAEAEALNAKVESETSEKKQVDEELAWKKKERTECKADYDKKQKMRAKEAWEYAESSAEAKANYESTLAATKALEEGMGGSFLQTEQGAAVKKIIAAFADRDTMAMSDKETVSAFLQGDYQPASGQIVGILKNMADEMEKDIADAAADEEAAIKANDELCAAKKKEYYACTDAVESLTKRSGELAVSVVQNKNSAKDAAEEAADATAFVANLKKTCTEKKAAFEADTVTRAQEVEAISKAIAILNEDDALDLFKKTLKSPPKEAAPVAFLQKMVTKSSKLTEVRALLATQKKSKNVAVALMQNMVVEQVKSAEKVGSKGDFTKVNKMIEDMVALLKEEGEADETSKKYCEKELDTSEDSATKIKTEGKALKSQIAQCKDEIANLTDEIKSTESRMAATDKSVAEATEQRKNENAEFTTNLQANNMAIELIGKAKNKMLQFYNPDLAVTETEPEMTTGDELAASFVQTSMRVGQPGPAPETASYKSNAQGGQTIVALMDKLINELEVGNADAENEEKTSQKDYEELLADAEESKKCDTKAVCDKKSSKADIEEALGEESREYTLKATALKDTMTYIADLHKQCDFILAEFDNRKEARGAEISGLKKAKAVLAGADYKFF